MCSCFHAFFFCKSYLGMSQFVASVCMSILSRTLSSQFLLCRNGGPNVKGHGCPVPRRGDGWLRPVEMKPLPLCELRWWQIHVLGSSSHSQTWVHWCVLSCFLSCTSLCCSSLVTQHSWKDLLILTTQCNFCGAQFYYFVVLTTVVEPSNAKTPLITRRMIHSSGLEIK